MDEMDEEKSEKIVKKIVDETSDDEFFIKFGDYPENLVDEDNLELQSCENCLLNPCCSERCEKAFEEIKSFIYYNKYMYLKESIIRSYENKIIKRRIEERQEKKLRHIKRRVIKKLGYNKATKNLKQYLCPENYWKHIQEEKIHDIWRKNCTDKSLLYRAQNKKY